MTRRDWFTPAVGIVLAVLALVAAVLVYNAVTPAPAPNALVHNEGLALEPDNPDNCADSGSDQATQLQNLINNTPDGSTVTLPYHSCWTVYSQVHIKSNTDVTVNGNGAEIYQPYPQGADTTTQLGNLTTGLSAGVSVGTLSVAGPQSWGIPAGSQITVTEQHSNAATAVNNTANPTGGTITLTTAQATVINTALTDGATVSVTGAGITPAVNVSSANTSTGVVTLSADGGMINTLATSVYKLTWSQNFVTMGMNYPGNLTLNVHTVSNPNFSYTTSDAVTLNNAATPILFLTQDTGLKIENLDVVGAFDGTHFAGAAYEAAAGIQLQGEVGTVLTGMIIEDTQGDFFDVQSPNNITGNALNTGVVLSDSYLNNVGYHALSIEATGPTASCPNRTLPGQCGTIVTGNRFRNLAGNPIDLENDDGTTGTVFSGQWPTYAANDNVLISNNVFAGWSGLWFSSQQSFNTQEQNVVLSGNTLNSGQPLVDVRGTAFGAACTGPPVVCANAPRDLNIGLTISNNTNSQASPSVNSASCTGSFTGSPMVITSVVDVSVTGNNFPVLAGCDGNPGNPYQGALSPSNNQNLSVMNNLFPGAQGTYHGVGGSTGTIIKCNNSWGAAGTKTGPGNDGACP